VARIGSLHTIPVWSATTLLMTHGHPVLRSGIAVAVFGKYLYAIGGRNCGEQTYYNKVE